MKTQTETETETFGENLSPGQRKKNGRSHLSGANRRLFQLFIRFIRRFETKPNRVFIFFCMMNFETAKIRRKNKISPLDINLM